MPRSAASSREVKEDIRAVRMDPLCRLLRRKRRQISIAVRHIRRPARHLGALAARIVESDLKARTIIRREQLHGKVQHDMIRDVRREIADAQLLPPALFVREPRHGADHCRIRGVRVPQFLIRNSVGIVKVHQIVAQRRKALLMIPAREFPCEAQMRQRLLQICQPEEDLPHEFMEF